MDGRVWSDHFRVGLQMLLDGVHGSKTATAIDAHLLQILNAFKSGDDPHRTADKIYQLELAARKV